MAKKGSDIDGVGGHFDNLPEDRRDDGIYSRAPESTYTIPHELYHLKKHGTSTEYTWLTNADAIGFDTKGWQSDPSRIIYHGGRYHMWMIDLKSDEERLKVGLSRILYVVSEDTYTWSAVGYIPLGPKGSCYDFEIEQANVVFYEGGFYLFSEGFTTNIEKYGQRRAGITCLVADSPEGPWKQPEGVDLLIAPTIDDGESWDCVHVNNPRHVYLNGTWFMYYKSRRRPGAPTENGVATADSLLGPYKRYGNNPLMQGHGHFCWRYKHGLVMIPNYRHWMHWSEDGIRFAPVVCGPEVFNFGALYVPEDPLFGEPVSTGSSRKLWGFETVLKTPKEVRPMNWDVDRITFSFG